MIRVLFSVLAVVAAILAYIFGEPLLYAVAAGLLLVAIIALVQVGRKRHREAQTPYVPPAVPASPDEELQSLGIMEIRAKASKSSAGSTEPSNGASEFAPPAAAASTTPSASRSRQKDAHEEGDRPEVVERPRYDHVLIPHLQSLHAALNAHTVCLLRQDAMTPQYRIEALVSNDNDVQKRGSFRISNFLLTPTLMERSVTVRHVGGDGIPASSLGFYRTRAEVNEVAFAPVPRPSTDTTAIYFLLADTKDTTRLAGNRPRTLMAQFARLTGLLLEGANLEAIEEEELAPAIKPRREIIAEEMQKAREQEAALALAIVYLNDAEDVADQGEVSVMAAEQIMSRRLRDVAAPSRVERFGELMYGIFYHAPVEVDAWASRIQAALAEDPMLPEGGVSVGVAMLQDHHPGPSEFRADATIALREAYESGACTILD